MQKITLTNAEKQELTDLLEYEIGSRWWTGFITNGFLQEIAGTYFRWLTLRKYNRFRQFRNYRRMAHPIILN